MLSDGLASILLVIFHEMFFLPFRLKSSSILLSSSRYVESRFVDNRLMEEIVNNFE